MIFINIQMGKEEGFVCMLLVRIISDKAYSGGGASETLLNTFFNFCTKTIILPLYFLNKEDKQEIMIKE